MTAVLVMHAIGDPAGGRPWIDAFAAAGMSAAAPDQPGHAGAAPIVGRAYQLDDPAVTAAAWFGTNEHVDTLVGVGASGWAAQVAALGGRCDRLVLVDGLGGPFVSVAELMRERRARMRAMVEEPLEPMTDGLDPRVRYVGSGHQDLDLALQAALAIPVPTLVVESPSSATSSTDAQAIVEAGTFAFQRVEQSKPVLVAACIAAWLDASA